MKKKNVHLIFLILFMLVSEFTLASTVALTFTLDPPQPGDPNNVITTDDIMAGWTFQTNDNVLVDSLGFWDYQQNGLGEAHDVGLWTNDGVLLASTTIQSGTASLLIGEFRFESITPILLQSGQIYRIGAYYPEYVASQADELVSGNANVSTISEITYLQRAFASSIGGVGGLVFPDGTNSNSLAANFGPTFTVATVPLPATVYLFGSGLLGLIGISRRKRPA